MTCSLRGSVCLLGEGLLGSGVAGALRRYTDEIKQELKLCWKFSIFEVSVLIAFCNKLLLFEGMANSVHQALNSDQER